MSALEILEEIIKEAIEEDIETTLAVLGGAHIGLILAMVKQKGEESDADKQITIEGIGIGRKLTIHAKGE